MEHGYSSAISSSWCSLHEVDTEVLNRVLITVPNKLPLRFAKEDHHLICRSRVGVGGRSRCE